MKNKYVLIDVRAEPLFGDALRSHVFRTVIVPTHTRFDEPICAHPDVFAFVHDKTVIADADTVLTIKKQTDDTDSLHFIEAEPRHGERVGYPLDCTLNAAKCGKTLIGLAKRFDAALTDYAQNNGWRIIEVNQGYAKCNICAVSENAIITEDAGVAKRCTQSGMDVLLLQSHAVRLDGYAYGFFGGAGGRSGGTVYFCGDIKTHPEYERIARFIDHHGADAVSLGKGELIDCGSLLFFG